MSTLHQRLLVYFRDIALQPGDSIPTEQRLCVILGVSRPILRESMAVLEAMGAVNSRQGARRRLGSFDASILVDELLHLLPPTENDLRELLDVRRVLEVAFFPIAVASMSSSKIRDLRAITDRMEAKAARGMPFLEEDASFHASIFGHLGNRTLEGLLTAFWKTFNASSEETRTGHDLPASARSHSQIVDALETGDTALAVHQLNVHFFDVRTRLSSQKKSASTPATLITTGEG